MVFNAVMNWNDFGAPAAAARSTAPSGPGR
jgi:hypothetical protein